MDIDKLREEYGENEEISEQLVELKSRRRNMSLSKIEMAKLFIICYDLMFNHIESIRRELSFYNVEQLRTYVEDYDSKNLIGGIHYINETRINENVMGNRKAYLELINNFFKIFGEEN